MTYIRTKEHNEKMRKIQLAKRKEYSQKAKKMWANPAFRKKRSKISKSSEVRNKHSIAMKKRWAKDHERLSKVCGGKGRKMPAEQKEELSKLVKKRWANPKFKKKMNIIQNTEEYKEKRRNISKKLWKDPNYRNKTHSAIIKAMEKDEYKIKMSKAVSGEKNPNFKGWLSREPYGIEFSPALKRKVRKRYNYKCQHCGIEESNCREKLHSHHIDYDKNNNSIDNLIALCRGCHTLTSNSKRNIWKRKFQKMIQKKKLELKSSVVAKSVT